MFHIGSVIQQQRKLLKITQQQLCERSGIDVMTISRIERGITKEPERETLLALAKPLQTTVEAMYAQLPNEGRTSPVMAGMDAEDLAFILHYMSWPPDRRRQLRETLGVMQPQPQPSQVARAESDTT